MNDLKTKYEIEIIKEEKSFLLSRDITFEKWKTKPLYHFTLIEVSTRLRHNCIIYDTKTNKVVKIKKGEVKTETCLKLDGYLCQFTIYDFENGKPIKRIKDPAFSNTIKLSTEKGYDTLNRTKAYEVDFNAGSLHQEISLPLPLNSSLVSLEEVFCLCVNNLERDFTPETIQKQVIKEII